MRANFGWRICSDIFPVSLSLIFYYRLVCFMNRWHQLAAHSQSSQSSPCWVAETLALRRRFVFLASSAVFQRRDPDEFYSDRPIPEGVMWTLGDSLLIHKWTWPHGGRWGSSFFLLGLIQLCQKITIPNYIAKELFWPWMLVSLPLFWMEKWVLSERVTSSELWWMVIGRTQEAGNLIRPLCCTTYNI